MTHRARLAEKGCIAIEIDSFIILILPTIPAIPLKHGGYLQRAHLHIYIQIALETLQHLCRRRLRFQAPGARPVGLFDRHVTGAF